MSASTPETVLYNGTVHTVDAQNSRAEAVAIRGEEIVAVGRSSDLLASAGATTRRIDLDGRTVTPGFIDAHPHMDGVGATLLGPRWGDIRSIDDVLVVVRREAARVGPGQWVVLKPFAVPPEGYAFPALLRERRWPNRHDLDAAAPDNPVYIEPHIIAPPGIGIANTAALKSAQLPSDDALPANLKIERDGNGEPTGVFIDYNYPRKIPVRGWPGAVPGFPATPGPAEGGAMRAVRSGMKAFNRAGITAIYERHGMPANVIAAYRELHANRELSVRAYCPVAFPVPAYSDAALADRIVTIGVKVAGGNFVGDDLLRIGGLGFSFDSAAGAGNSLMHAPYRGTQGQTWNGIQLASDEQLRAAIQKTAQAGLRVQIQCTGDAAIDKVLAIFEETDRTTPLFGKRWVIEHCRQMLARKAGYDGRTMGPDQSITRAEALRASTFNGAYAMFWVDGIGSIEPGKLADLAILSADIMTIPEDEILATTVDATLLGGKPVHDTGLFAGVKRSGTATLRFDRRPSTSSG